MPNPVAHFEIYGDNPEKLGDFYKGVFGWEIKDAGVPGYPYWLINTVPTDAKGAPTQPGGINGGLMKRPMPDARNWVSYVTVASLDKTLEKAKGMGATVIRPKSAVPKQGWFAILTDPEMNTFAIWQDDTKAT